MNVKTIITIFLALNTLVVLGQGNEAKSAPTVAQFNASLYLGIPSDDFSENLEGIGIGGGGSILFRLRSQPIFFGAEVGIMGYDKLLQQATFNIGGFLKDYELETNSNILTAHALFRIKPDFSSPIVPYVDGLIGIKSLFTRTKLRDLDLPEDDDIVENRREQGDIALSYGGALGLQLHLFRNNDIVIDLKCAYLPGGNASYLVQKENLDGLTFDSPIDAYDEKASPTNLIIPQIGILFNITSNTFTDSTGEYYNQ